MDSEKMAHKHCFTYCGDDKCDCPARGFDHSLERRVEELESEVRRLGGRVRHHDLMTMRFGGRPQNAAPSRTAYSPEFPERITKGARERQRRDIIGP